jgi:hypothetical protein
MKQDLKLIQILMKDNQTMKTEFYSFLQSKKQQFNFWIGSCSKMEEY